MRVSLHSSSTFTFKSIFQNAIAIALADLLASQILEPRPQWSVDVVVLAKEAILSRVVKGIELVAPMAGEVEEADGCFGGQV